MFYIILNKIKVFPFFCFLFFSFSSVSNASVVISGTRLIYNSEDSAKTIQLNNKDAFPNVVQAWIDVGDEESSPENSKAPFFLSPAIFRMDANSGQNLRIIFTGSESLPEDRESLFHLNVLQIPPRDIKKSNKNQMLLMLKNRLKLFYRPKGISGNPSDLSKNIIFKLNHNNNIWSIDVENKSGYFASFGNAEVEYQEGRATLKHSMVAPYSKKTWEFDTPFKKPEGPISIRTQLINDYGARIDLSQKLDH